MSGIKFEHTFAERLDPKTGRGKRIILRPLGRQMPRRWVLRIHIDRYSVDRWTLRHPGAGGQESLTVEWISRRHLYKLYDKTFKVRLRHRVRRILWGVTP